MTVKRISGKMNANENNKSRFFNGFYLVLVAVWHVL